MCKLSNRLVTGLFLTATFPCRIYACILKAPDIALRYHITLNDMGTMVRFLLDPTSLEDKPPNEMRSIRRRPAHYRLHGGNLGYGKVMVHCHIVCSRER